jgi:hypothetical protein
MKSRELFTDGWNSFWHLFFGVLSGRFLVILPIFVIYQLFNFHDKNLYIDLSEFFIGFFGIIIVSALNNHKKTIAWLKQYIFHVY